jgi:DNA-binding MurR/RpiR family transcriptional regulator
MSNLPSQIRDQHAKLSPTMQQASSYILSHLPDIPFESIRNLAQNSCVSPLTIIRLTRQWGFAGYPDFQAAVRRHLFAGNNQVPDALAAPHQLNSPAIAKAAQMINEAGNVYITGLRNAHAFALYMNYMGRMVFNNFHLMPSSAPVTAEDLARLSSDDLLIAFSTSPYATETVRLMQAAQQLGIPTIAVTDASRSPIAQTASVIICVPITKQARLYQMAPVISAIEQILETCYDDPATNADKRITDFAERVKSIKGYW